MSGHKRNHFLEGDESEVEIDNGYDSDANEEGRGAIVGRTSKRRRLERASDEESLDEAAPVDVRDARDEDSNEEYHTANDDLDAAQQDEDSADDDVAQNGAPSSLKASAPKQVAAAQKAARRSGVIYISRVPPFMKPQTLKHLLTPHASKGIGYVFLTPEDQAAHSRRVKSGGNKKKSYTDGWVEFKSKREAKIAAETLNGNIIGGKKGSFYHDDLWSMKYLKSFKWSHLTEQIANENAERAARMREEVRKTRQENKTFVEDIERGKMLEGMEAKMKAKGGTDASSNKAFTDRRPLKAFKQKAVKKTGTRMSDAPSQQVSKVQKMIF